MISILLNSLSGCLFGMPAAENKKIILYAPTFRGRVAKAESPDCLDIPAMKRALGDEYVLLIKHHPFVKQPPVVPEDCADFCHGCDKEPG